MNSFRCAFGSLQYTIFGLLFAIAKSNGGFNIYLFVAMVKNRLFGF